MTKKITIVDDDPDILKAIQYILENAGYSVLTAQSKDAGMEQLIAAKPDLLILDVMMSTWHDGFEMAREIKKDETLSRIPILMLTGVKGKTGIDFKSTAGDPTWLPVEGFLDKPVKTEALLEEVQRLLA